MRRASWHTLEDTLGTGSCRLEMGELLPFQPPSTTSRVCRAPHLPRVREPGVGWGVISQELASLLQVSARWTL